MKALTVAKLYEDLKKQVKLGHGDYIVFVTDDEECNGYHALWFDGQVPTDMSAEDREYAEEINHDLPLVKNNTNKAYYIG